MVSFGKLLKNVLTPKQPRFTQGVSGDETELRSLLAEEEQIRLRERLKQARIRKSLRDRNSGVLETFREKTILSAKDSFADSERRTPSILKGNNFLNSGGKGMIGKGGGFGFK